MLLFCSPVSISRPWVNFEAGCGWIKRIPIIPICHSGQGKGMLPAPLAVFQALEVASDRFVADLLDSLAKHLDVPKVPRVDQSAMRRELDNAVGSLSRTPRPAPAAAADVSPIDETAVQILILVSKLGDDGYSAEQLAPHFQMATPKMDYYLDILVDTKLLYRHLFMGGPSRYTLTKAGRRFLVEKGLL